MEKWKEFRDTGLLWWINMILHTFGWSIFFEIDKNKNIINVYPERTDCRGFRQKENTEGYIKVSQYMKNNAVNLLEESKRI